jgi:hypothetical protein
MATMSIERIWVFFPICCLACEAPLTRQEAAEALEEIQVASQASALTSGTVEISTNFTIGEAVERAAEELSAFVRSQLPCAEVNVAPPTLVVEYGKNGVCAPYRGQVLEGIHRISVSKNEHSDVIVDHVWEGLTNGRVALDGTATVTWTTADPSRRVQHDLEWTRLSDGRTGVGSGDRVQRPLSGGISEGIVVDGERRWEGERGIWDLSIDGVEVHWRDPIPRAGRYALHTPFDKSVSVRFSEIDETTILVRIDSGRRDYEFRVNSAR